MAFDNRTRDVLYPLLNNLYFICLDIIDVCAKWVPRRTREDERIWLAQQLRRECVEVPMYLHFLSEIGRKPDERHRITNSTERYARIKASEDELDVVVGMNALAQGVFGNIEHRQFYRFDPDFFAPVHDTITFEMMNLERACEFMRRRDQEHLQEVFARWHHHLVVETVPALTPFLDPVIAVGVFEPDIVDQGLRLYEEIARSVGIDPSQLSTGVGANAGAAGTPEAATSGSQG